jgi:PAS domain S-box-containing protein
MRSLEELSLIALIADDLPCGVWVAAVPDGRFVYANRAFDEIMGMGPVPEAAAGGYAQPYGIYRRTGELYPEDRMPFVRAVEAKSTVVVDDIVIHRRDGRRVYVRAFGKPLFDAEARMTHVAIAFFDISREIEAQEAQARAETERAEMRDRLSRVIEHAPMVLFAFGRDGVVSAVEGRGLERLGLGPRDFLGRSMFDIFPQERIIAESARRALAGETVSYAVRLNVSGEGVFETRLVPLRSEAGEVTGALGISLDVTELRKMEAQLARAERLASVGMLAAGVAHEINNPLSYVVANLDIIARALGIHGGAVPGPDRLRMTELVNDAREGAARIGAIVRDLKMFSRVQDQPLSSVDLQAPIAAAVKLAQNEIRHRAHLLQDLEPVPRVWADEGRLGQLFLNLLVNAAQAIPEGDADRNTVRLATATSPDGWAVVTVADTGAGMTPEVLARIFDPFFTTKPHGVGTGLGLAIGHAIVTDLGGRIEVESDVGRGSTFRVRLPPAPAPPEARPAPPAAPAASLRRGSVLVIDDEPPILRVVEAILEGEHDVTCESRAQAALERVRGGARYDVVLCDLMMPQMTGMDLYEALLAIDPKLARATIFLTGGAFTARARAFLDAIKNPTLEKPFDAATLLARVRSAVGGS